MPVVQAIARSDLANAADAEALSWIGVASEDNRMRAARWRSDGRRVWSRVDRHDRFKRVVQGSSYFSNFTVGPNFLIWTANEQAPRLQIDFEEPVSGAGLDVFADPAGVFANQQVRVTMSVIAGGVAQAPISIVGPADNFVWIGAVSDADPADITQIAFTADVDDGNGAFTASGFAVNRLELRVPVGLVA